MIAPFSAFRALSLALAAFVLIAPGHSSAADDDMSKVEITTTDLGGGIFMLMGKGGNMGLSASPDGVFLIDDQFAPLSDKIKAAIAKITDKPVRFVLNTHWHFDHTGGNEAFGKAGAVIVAHDAVRERISTDQFIATFNRKVPASPKGALPVITFNDTATFHLNGATIRVQHMPSSHTDGDSFVAFPDADVIHTGDIVFNGFYPFIDVDHGGSIDGMITATERILALAGPKTKIIPGHGPLATKIDLIAYRDMLVAARDAVKALMDAGKSEADIIAAKPTAALDTEWADGFLKPDVFVKLVYDSLRK